MARGMPWMPVTDIQERHQLESDIKPIPSAICDCHTARYALSHASSPASGGVDRRSSGGDLL